jgi:hypothetical protein
VAAGGKRVWTELSRGFPSGNAKQDGTVGRIYTIGSAALLGDRERDFLELPLRCWQPAATPAEAGSSSQLSRPPTVWSEKRPSRSRHRRHAAMCSAGNTPCHIGCGNGWYAILSSELPSWAQVDVTGADRLKSLFLERMSTSTPPYSAVLFSSTGRGIGEAGGTRFSPVFSWLAASTAHELFGEWVGNTIH